MDYINVGIASGGISAAAGILNLNVDMYTYLGELFYGRITGTEVVHTRSDGEAVQSDVVDHLITAGIETLSGGFVEYLSDGISGTTKNIPIVGLFAKLTKRLPPRLRGTIAKKLIKNAFESQAFKHTLSNSAEYVKTKAKEWLFGR